MFCAKFKKFYLCVGLSVALLTPALAGPPADCLIPGQDPFSRGDVREAFRYAKDHPACLSPFVNAVLGRDAPPYVLAYLAAAQGLQAKHSRNVFNKMGLLKVSLRGLDSAVTASPEDLDVRFVRFASYQNFPNLLGIGKKRGQDVEALIELLQKADLKAVDRDFRRHILEALLKSDRLNRDQLVAVQAQWKDMTKK